MSWTKFKNWVDGEVEAFNFDAIPAKGEKKACSGVSVKEDTQRKAITIVSIISAAVIFAVLMSVVYTVPLFGTGVATDNDLSIRYVEQGMGEVGAQNLVANMILVYRGFDTFGESTVLFTAATCVIMLLMVGGHSSHAEVKKVKKTKGKSKSKSKAKPAFTPVLTVEAEPNTTILQTVVRGLFPFVFVFGVYILLNGHLSPGGGFSGGAVMGAGLILLDVSLGTETLGKFFNHTIYTIIKVGALCIYGAVILYLVICGANGINNGISLGVAGHIFSAGVILPINLMVGFEVACTMYAFFTYFYRGELK